MFAAGNASGYSGLAAACHVVGKLFRSIQTIVHHQLRLAFALWLVLLSLSLGLFDFLLGASTLFGYYKGVLI
jgi:hypothetical protein